MDTAPSSVAELDNRAAVPTEAAIDALRSIDGPIVVAGAGGKMGFHLCRMLYRALESLGKTPDIRAVSRFGDAETRSAFESAGLHVTPADLTTDEGVSSLPDAVAVFYLAGRKFGTADSPETLRLFNEEMPARVAHRYRHVPIVALSTGCVYPFVSPESGGSVETDPIGPAGDYAISCAGRERAFLSSSEKHRTPLALIRLNYSVDLRYGVLVDIASRVWEGKPVDVAMGYLNCIWQGDAVAATIASISRAAPAPNAFILNVTGEQILSVREVAQWFAKRFQRSVTVSGTEADTAWLNNASLSHQLFGAPTTSEETLMEWVADWIENDRPLLGKPTHFEVRDGKY